MALDFPSSPTIGQTYTSGNSTWVWDGVKWNPAPGTATYLPLTGGTLTGPLVLNADPAVPLGAATKAYVDEQITIGTQLIQVADQETALAESAANPTNVYFWV